MRLSARQAPADSQEGRWVLWGISCLFILTYLNPVHSANAAPEYSLKAVFIYNFTQYTRWPNNAFSSPSSPFKLCIWKHNPFGQHLKKAIRKEKVRGRAIQLIALKGSTKRIKSCHLLFVAARDKAHYARILKMIGNSPVLTLGETPDFVARGGMVYFYRHKTKIRMAVAPKKARKAGLKISSSVLKLSRIID